MLEIEIDGKKLTVPDGSTVMEAAEAVGTYIPHFCYHKKLSVAANCRMCLVQVEKAPKPLPACATPVTDGMRVFTKSDLAVKAQQGVMEFLLINHPLDCPICDQGGECQLQDLAVGYGDVDSRFSEVKRVVPNKDLGPLISTDMTRCIHCTRCVRFSEEIAGAQEIGMAGRGEHSEVMSFIGLTVDSEISGNVIDLCPVGALTSKPFRYQARSWELSRRKGVSPHDGLGSNLILQTKGGRVVRVLPRENESINECWISDRDRFSYEALMSSERLLTPELTIGGQVVSTSWDSALSKVAEEIKGTIEKFGADSIGVVASPNSTVEELYLINKLFGGGLGVRAINTFGRMSDYRLVSESEGVRWLGQSISELRQSDLFMIVGSDLRMESPLLAQQIRQSVKRGAELCVLSPSSSKQLCRSVERIVRPDELLSSLVSIAHSVVVKIGKSVPAVLQLAGLLADDDPMVEAIAKVAGRGGRISILLGEQVENSPQALEIAKVASLFAEAISAEFGWSFASANKVGAQLLTVDSADPTFSRQRKMLIGFGVDLCADSPNAQLMSHQVRAADALVLFSPFKPLSHVAPFSASLPVAPFSETGGSYINIEGVVQAFNGAVRCAGDARPGWKVLRVLGNLLSIPGFDYQSVEDVRRAALGDLEKLSSSTLNNSIDVEDVRINEKHNALIRVGDVPIYQSDAVVRRSHSLQETKLAGCSRLARMNSKTLSSLMINHGDNVLVSQGGAEFSIVAEEDDTLPDFAVALPAVIDGCGVLGELYGPISVKKNM
ncbi:NADH-quinone oxidoreductase subunit NuoG [Parachitinimonas caeni]|uniref:NADH-quinone oxidoreductase n=1 Tax=Parachitinimonas caeni TaxID=3031301 RepID=A0ABT7DXP5_9NEIS|nr:NADH-quinone oxidoreductase subunit NuoG [Parachitinimonas caeni]MDK2124805.1 NADH-quinone oxidoreductase subunit NuoG [Parachitinimonas caeni]